MARNSGSGCLASINRCFKSIRTDSPSLLFLKSLLTNVVANPVLPHLPVLQILWKSGLATPAGSANSVNIVFYVNRYVKVYDVTEFWKVQAFRRNICGNEDVFLAGLEFLDGGHPYLLVFPSCIEATSKHFKMRYSWISSTSGFLSAKIKTGGVVFIIAFINLRNFSSGLRHSTFWRTSRFAAPALPTFMVIGFTRASSRQRS